MRLFAALLPPEPALDELARAVDGLRALPGADRLRWTQRANWHLTLAFYGEVGEDVRPELCERLARAAARSRPLVLRVAGGGRFGERLLWAGVAPAPGDGAEQEEGPARDARAGAPAGSQAGPEAAAARTLGELRRLAGAANAAGRRAGIAVDEPRRFRAHLTLAHVRGRGHGGPHVDLRPYTEALDEVAGSPWTARELTLVRSHLPDSGVPGEQPRYERVAGWPLGG